MQFSIRVGTDRRIEHTADRRTPFQQATVMALAERDDFDYAFPNSAFEEGVDTGYTGPFFFGWVDTSQVFHGLRIGARRIIHEWTQPWAELTRPRPGSEPLIVSEASIAEAERVQNLPPLLP